MEQQEIEIRLQQLGIDMSFVCLDEGSPERESKFRITITRNGEAYSFDYAQGCALRRWCDQLLPSDEWCKKHSPQRAHSWERESVDLHKMRQKATVPTDPTLTDVMYCLVMDAGCVRHGQTFEDFCDELGYDSDSRREEGIYKACTEAWRALVRMGLDLDELDELFQDY